MNVRYNGIDDSYSISEDSLLSYKMKFGASRSAGTYRMYYKSIDSFYILRGEWKSHKKIFFKYRSVGAWFDQRKSFPLPEPPSRGDSSSVPKKDPVLERPSEIQSLIEIPKQNTDSVKLEIYDNGIVDNDSISLYLDDSLLISKQMISASPITYTIPPGSIKSLGKLKLIAENMGSIPPCTALMIIYIQNKRYDGYLSSNFEKNAVVEFFLKE